MSARGTADKVLTSLLNHMLAPKPSSGNSAPALPPRPQSGYGSSSYGQQQPAYGYGVPPVQPTSYGSSPSQQAYSYGSSGPSYGANEPQQQQAYTTPPLPPRPQLPTPQPSFQRPSHDMMGWGGQHSDTSTSSSYPPPSSSATYPPPISSTSSTTAPAANSTALPPHLQDSLDRYRAFLESLAGASLISSAVQLSKWTADELRQWRGPDVVDEISARMAAVGVNPSAPTTAAVEVSPSPAVTVPAVPGVPATSSSEPPSLSNAAAVFEHHASAVAKIPEVLLDEAQAATEAKDTEKTEEPKKDRKPTRAPNAAELALKDTVATLEPYIAEPSLPDQLSESYIKSHYAQQAYTNELDTITNNWYTIQGQIAEREGNENAATSTQREKMLEGMHWELAWKKREEFEKIDRQVKRGRRSQTAATWQREIRDKAWALLGPIEHGIRMTKAGLRDIAVNGELVGEHSMCFGAWQAVFAAEKDWKRHWGSIQAQERELAKNDRTADGWDDEADAGNPGTVWNIINQIDEDFKKTEENIKSQNAADALNALYDRVQVENDLGARRAARWTEIQNSFLPVLAAALPTDDPAPPAEAADGPGRMHGGYTIISDALTFAKRLYNAIDRCYSAQKEGEKAIRNLMTEHEVARMWTQDPMAAWVQVDQYNKTASETNDREQARATQEAEQRRKVWEGMAGEAEKWVAEREKEEQAIKLKEMGPMDAMSAMAALQRQQMQTQMISNAMWSMHASRMSVINNIGSSNSSWVVKYY